MFGLFKKSPAVTLEQQIEVLHSLGIQFPAGFTVEKALAEWPRKRYERDPYEMVVMYLGGDELDESPRGWSARSNQFWHFDTECIEDNGAYADIAKRLMAMAQGDLPLQDISDEVDIEAGIAILRFTLDGQSHEWKLEVNDDWVDGSVFQKLCNLHEARPHKGRFTWLDLAGQDCVISYASEAERLRLNEVTGLDFAPLKEAPL